VRALTRIGSDHNPIPVEDGEGESKVKRGFVFETAWLSNEDFNTQLKIKWPERGGGKVQDFWKKIEERD
jgi:hypothetical protein